MIKPPPCWSHEGMKLLDIFLFSSRGAPSPISSTAFCSEKISGSDLAQIWSVRQRWPTVRGRRTPLDYPEKVQNSLSVSRGRSSCTFLTYLMASLYRERPTPSSQTCRVFALVSQRSFRVFTFDSRGRSGRWQRVWLGKVKGVITNCKVAIGWCGYQPF